MEATVFYPVQQYLLKFFAFDGSEEAIRDESGFDEIFFAKIGQTFG